MENPRTTHLGPFGEVIRATGPMAKLNPFGWGGGMGDPETDLVYYGYRYYNPSTGRWLSRDPAEEGEGGPNLYAFCDNDSIDGVDLLGLWKIHRTNRNRADAIPDPGDTVQQLAIGIRLDDKDYMQWLKPVGPTQMPTSVTAPINSCSAFTIPNTIYFDLGPNVGDATIVKLWDKSARQLQIQYEIAGYNAVLTPMVTYGQMKDHLSHDGIYRYFFYGHGAGTGVVAATDQDFNPLRYTPYGIYSVEIWACMSAQAYKIPGAPFKYNEWELNVATRGYFLGLANTPSLVDPPIIVVTPGVNSDWHR